MKKLIAILLVVLVAGFVFAEDEGAAAVPALNSTVLTLKSAVGGRATHGFHGGALKNSFSEVFTADPSEEATNNLGNLEKLVDMESTNIQNVGYYSFASNSNASFTVKMDVTPMTLIVEEGESSSSLLYVPFLLQFNKGAGPTGTSQTANIYNTSGIPGAVALEENDEVVLVSSTSSSQLNWASYGVAVQFYGDSNVAYGLPQGDYVSTITASITTP
ncbi:MAG: hypothetical protein ACOXZ6_04245 [Syntrophomonadaceae bacterium]|jgi:hypothetical protein